MSGAYEAFYAKLKETEKLWVKLDDATRPTHRNGEAMGIVKQLLKSADDRDKALTTLKRTIRSIEKRRRVQVDCALHNYWKSFYLASGDFSDKNKWNELQLSRSNALGADHVVET
jgi:hypothetical protein